MKVEEIFYETLFFALAILNLHLGQVGASDNRRESIRIATCAMICLHLLIILKFFLSEKSQMEVSDAEQRDVIPAGDFLKAFINKGHLFQVDYLGVDWPMTNIDNVTASWKAYFKSLALPVTGGNFVGQLTGPIPPGLGDEERIGRRVRIRGIEFSFRYQLISDEQGHFYAVGADYTTSSKQNGPCTLRVVLLVRPRSSGTGTVPSVAGTWAGFAPPYALLTEEAINDGVAILFDKTYTFSSEGDQICDKVFIDCVIPQTFDDEVGAYAVRNDVEIWTCSDYPEFGGFDGSCHFRMWFEDE